MMHANPFPADLGRVCYHPCETACNRGELDEAVGINAVERFLGDEALAGVGRWRSTAPPPASGCWWSARPGRTSAAYHLRCAGTPCVGAGAAPGGMMRYGIPGYRLPRDVLDAEWTGSPTMGRHLELPPGTDLAGPAIRRGVGRRLPGGRRAAGPTYLPARRLAAPGSLVSLLHGLGDGRAPAARPAADHLRRRQHRYGRRADRPPSRRPGRSGHLPPHPRPDAGPR